MVFRIDNVGRKTVVFCKNCGTQIKDDAIFCPYCGTKTGVQEPEKKEEPQVDIREKLLAGAGETAEKAGAFVSTVKRKAEEKIPGLLAGVQHLFRNGGKKLWIGIGTGAAALIVLIAVIAGIGAAASKPESDVPDAAKTMKSYVIYETTGEIKAKELEELVDLDLSSGTYNDKPVSKLYRASYGKDGRIESEHLEEDAAEERILEKSQVTTDFYVPAPMEDGTVGCLDWVYWDQSYRYNGAGELTSLKAGSTSYTISTYTEGNYQYREFWEDGKISRKAKLSQNTGKLQELVLYSYDTDGNLKYDETYSYIYRANSDLLEECRVTSSDSVSDKGNSRFTYTYDTDGKLRKCVMENYMYRWFGMAMEGYRQYIVKFDYDDKGRLIHREKYNGQTPDQIEEEIDYIYDEQGAVSKVTTTSSSYSEGVLSDGTIVEQCYDREGRLTDKICYDVRSAGKIKTYSGSYSYDEYGRRSGVVVTRWEYETNDDYSEAVQTNEETEEYIFYHKYTYYEE